MPVTSNWNDVRQGIIDAISDHSKSFKNDALNDIKVKLAAKGIKSTTIINNSIETTAANASEYATGKVYFDEVFKDINNQSWVDNI